MTRTNTTFINPTAKNTAEMQLLTEDQRALWGMLLVTVISKLPIDSQKTTVLLMLAQTCPQLPTAQSHDKADITNISTASAAYWWWRHSVTLRQLAPAYRAESN